MKISIDNIDAIREEPDVFNELLALDNKQIIELGCGKADLTRAIATGGEGRTVTAFEVDEIQHRENEKIADLPNVKFMYGGAQKIAVDDSSADVVFMFKSLHHVPLNMMGESFSEIHRVLKPDGYVYVSEPIFAGEFNEILRLFHDEEAVRSAAFEAEKNAVASGKFKLASQTFFNAAMHFEDFTAFEKLVLGVTHTDFDLTSELMADVKKKFESHLGEDGAHFQMPIRVDLLQCVK